MRQRRKESVNHGLVYPSFVSDAQIKIIGLIPPNVSMTTPFLFLTTYVGEIWIIRKFSVGTMSNAKMRQNGRKSPKMCIGCALK